jgi:DnaK suppressor protein
MEKNQLDSFRKALIARHEEVKKLNSDSKDSSATVELDQSTVGRLSRMDALQAQQMAQEAARRRQLQLQQIDSALRRMDAGDYGYCFICGDEIGAARLNFDPANTRCIGCMNN